jgi:hypothetical protein
VNLTLARVMHDVHRYCRPTEILNQIHTDIDSRYRWSISTETALVRTTMSNSYWPNTPPPVRSATLNAPPGVRHAYLKPMTGSGVSTRPTEQLQQAPSALVPTGGRSCHTCGPLLPRRARPRRCRGSAPSQEVRTLRRRRRHHTRDTVPALVSRYPLLTTKHT